MRDLIGELEQYLKKDEQTIDSLAKQLRTEEMPEITEELFAIYENTGNRLIFEQVYFTRRKFLAVYGMQSILHKKKEDIEKLCQVIEDICNEMCWELPAHVNRKEDPDWSIVVALFAAETAQALSMISYYLRDVLPEEIKAKVKSEVERRVLNPFFESASPYRNWEDCHHNWASVCGGSVGSALLFLYPDEWEENKPKLERIKKTLECYLHGFGQDGTCMEGIGYFGYGMTYFVGLAAQVYEITGGKEDWVTEYDCREIALFQQKCYFPCGMTISFSDGSRHEAFKLGLTCYLAGRFPMMEIPPVSLAAEFDTDSCFRFMAVWEDYFLTKRYVEQLKKEQIKEETEKQVGKQITLEAAQWTICHSSDGAGMAAKGGCNDEPHNHNDIGSFFYLAGEEMLLADLGAGEYTKDYFNENRYTIFCNQSFSHNVPIICGKGQSAGKEYRCDSFETDGKGKTTMSFQSAYEEKCLQELKRELKFDLENGGLELTDTFIWEKESEAGQAVENFVTEYEPAIAEGKIEISGKKEVLIMESTHITSAVTVEKVIHSNHSGEPVEVYVVRIPVEGSGIKQEFSMRLHRKV